jgi:adenylylsulfate kinase
LHFSEDAMASEDPRAGWAIWITGRPGSGKTTIAREVANALQRRGERVAILDANALAAALVPSRVPSQMELDLIHRALAYTASALTKAGVPAIIDATAPRRAWRDLARTLLEHFAEVQLVCPEAVCGAREQSVRWSRVAGVGTPVSAPSPPEVVFDYEYSLGADLTLDTGALHPWAAVEQVFALVERLRRHAAA